MLRRNGGRPGHIFNLGHGVLPELDPGVLDAGGRPRARGGPDRRWLSRSGVVVMAYGTPASPDDVEAYYTHIRRGTPPTRRAARRPDAALRRHRRHLAAGRAHRGAAGRARRPRSTSARPGGARVVLGQKHAAPFIEDARRRAGRRGRRRASSASCWRRTTPRRQRRPVPGPAVAAAADARGVARRRRSTRWHLEPAYLDFLAARRRATRWPTLPERHQGALHRPLAARAGAGRRPVPRPARERRPPPSPRRSGSTAGPAGRSRWQTRRPHARAVAGARHPRGDPRPRRPPAGPTACSCARRASSRPPRGALRPRHRGRRAWPTRSGSPSPAPGSLNDDPAVIGALADRVARRGADDRRRRRRRRHHRPGRRARGRARRRATSRSSSPGRLGGKVRTSAVRRRPCSTRRADAFLARVPEGVDLCRELGLDGELVSPAGAPGLRVEPRRAAPPPRGPGARRAHRPRRAGRLGDPLAPTGWRRVRGRPHHAARRARPATSPSARWCATGSATRSSSAWSTRWSAASTPATPTSSAWPPPCRSSTRPPAAARPTLIEACRAQRAAVADPGAPVFFAPRAGMGALVDALVRRPRRAAASRSVRAPPSRSSQSARRGTSPPTSGRRATTCRLARSLWPPTVWWSPRRLRRPPRSCATAAPRAATLLAAIPYASVALVSLAVPREAIDRELDGSGFLVPRVEGRTVTACSWTSSKWPHLAGDGTVWLRASVGRDGDDAALALDDDALVAAVLADLARHDGAARRPDRGAREPLDGLVPAVPPRPPRPRRRHRGRAAAARCGRRRAARPRVPRASAGPRARGLASA